jgi:hypothetical protein
MWKRYLIEPLKGKTSLSRVIWLYGFGVSAVYLLIEPLFTGSRLAHGLYYAVGLVIAILQSVMLWQCSYNAKSPTYGRVLRVLVVVGLLLIPYMLYLIWSHPELAELVG